MQTLKSIAKSLYKICFDVNRNIVGHPEIDARLFAKANSTRYAHIVRVILDYAYKNNKKGLKIFNASGLGDQDFSIVNFLLKNTEIDIEWKAFESPNSRLLTNNLFKRYLENLKIKLKLLDLSKMTTELCENNKEVYDIVIFTEIAEHIDHSTLLKALSAIREKMKKDGILIVTTPNLVELTNRIKFLFGNGDLYYFGDGTQNLEKRLYGHIVYYDINRLRRLMDDIGFKITNAYTFTYGYGPSEKFLTRYLTYKIIDLISFFFKNARRAIFIVAVKSSPKKIPFEV